MENFYKYGPPRCVVGLVVLEYVTQKKLEAFFFSEFDFGKILIIFSTKVVNIFGKKRKKIINLFLTHKNFSKYFYILEKLLKSAPFSITFFKNAPLKVH